MPERPPDIAPGQLVDVWLETVQFNRHRGFALDFENVTYNIDFENVPEMVDGHPEVRLGIRLEWSHAQDAEIPFDLALVVAGRFHWQDPEVEWDYLEGWLKFNGTYLLWPYLRTYVAMVTSNSDLPVLTLETLQIPQPALGHAEDSTAPGHAAG